MPEVTRTISYHSSTAVDGRDGWTLPKLIDAAQAMLQADVPRDAYVTVDNKYMSVLWEEEEKA